MKKQYVISSYTENSLAMYSANDFRLTDKSQIIKGTFTKTNTIKGKFNGYEIGIFLTEDGERYVVFYDYTVKKIAQGELIYEDCK